MEYVLNIVFSPDKENVLMVLKNRPAFLANLYNFVGGKLESHELTQIPNTSGGLTEMVIQFIFAEISTAIFLTPKQWKMKKFLFFTWMK